MQLNITKLNKELSALRVEKQEFTTKLSAFDEERAKLEGKIGELTAKLKTLEEEAQDAKKEEAAVVVAVEESVNKKVTQSLAAIGIPEGAVKEDVSAVPVITDSMEIYKRFDALKGKEKIEFFQKNEGIILGAMKQIHYSPVTTQPKKI